MHSRRALLAILISATGLSQSETARFLGVEDRTIRRWLDGDRDTPADAIETMTALLDEINTMADRAVAMIDGAKTTTCIVIYLRDTDLPGTAGMPSASAHRAMVRRVWEARPNNVIPVAFDRDAYHVWLGRRLDGPQNRAAWAAIFADEN
jgi:transcriptional regulator with XRE-family HTH domain